MATADALRLRLALLRQRIERDYLCVARFPVSDAPSTSQEFERAIMVSDVEFEGWDGENVLVWHRQDGADAWAVQAKCPHAMISLEMSDIEDFTASFPSTRGPCIACPAHVRCRLFFALLHTRPHHHVPPRLRAQMYVFDLGSGRCLTDDYTPRARTYPVRRSGPHAAPDGSSAPYYCLWLGREPRETVDDHEDDSLVPDLSVGNELQLQLVAKGLRRKFGADSFARG